MEVIMNGLKDDMYEFEEQPDEADLENPQLEMEIPDVHWQKTSFQSKIQFLEKGR
jgi:hypothetical protein